MDLPLWNLVLLAALSFFIHYLVIKLSVNSPFCMDSPEINKPQRSHNTATSRLGGLGILIPTLIGFICIGDTGARLALSAAPVILIGFYEDLKSNVSPRIRLLIIGAGAVLLLSLTDSILYDVGIFELSVWVAVPFTIFCIIGISNALNIIDGFNGLASGVAIIVLALYSVLSYMYNDQLLLSICAVLISAILGFFAWNFPKGRIFLGDGGAYLLGFLIAAISILLVKRNPEISPWTPIIANVYPIFEVFFTIYRRKLHGYSALAPDRMHLHSLVYKRIAKSNPRTSVYIWAFVAILNTAAFAYHKNTYMLMFVVFIFSFMYLYLYKIIVRFKLRLEHRLEHLQQRENR